MFTYKCMEIYGLISLCTWIESVATSDNFILINIFRKIFIFKIGNVFNIYLFWYVCVCVIVITVFSAL